MVFSSPTFLFASLPLVLLIYHAIPVASGWRNAWLLVVSGVFCFWGVGSAIVAITLVALTSFVGAYVAWRVTPRRSKDGSPTPVSRVPAHVALARCSRGLPNLG